MGKYVDGSLLLHQDRKVSVVCTGLTRPSTNIKTGPMAQTFILKRRVPPTYDVKGAGCDGCPVFDGCYVRWDQAPRSVYRTNKAGRYRKYEGSWEDLARLNDVAMRVGSAGEPTEMPVYLWMDILKLVKTWTGYTHKWRAAGRLAYRAFCMASVHSVADMKKANKMGWRTYRVGGEPITEDEIECPYYTHGVQCVDCGLCKGTAVKAKNIWVKAHGAHKNKIKEIA